MEKQYFEDFIKIFGHIKYAALIISNEFYEPRVKQKINEIELIVNQLNDDNSTLFKNILDEIEQNLHFPSVINEPYVISILRSFVGIAPYLNIAAVQEYGTELGKRIVKIDGRTYPNSLAILHKTLIMREAWRNHGWDEVPITIPEKYVILCFRAFRDFFNHLDVMSLNFNIDLMEVQSKLKMQIWVRDTPFLNKLGYSFVPQLQEVKREHKVAIEIKPHFKADSVQPIYDIIKDFFSLEHQIVLNQILTTGNNAEEKILFKGNGNRLTDTFKKLFEHDFIMGCQKQDLQNWIISNFNYLYRNEVKLYVFDTVEKIISRNDFPCKSPLIEIKNGQIQKVGRTRLKKQNKY